MTNVNRQIESLQKAKRSKSSDKISEGLARCYLEYCSEDFTSFHKFIELVNHGTGSHKTSTVKPTIPFKDFLQRYERELTLKEQL